MTRFLCLSTLIAAALLCAQTALAVDKLPTSPQLFVDLHRVENAHASGRWKRMDNIHRQFHQAKVHPRRVLTLKAPWEHHGFTTSTIYDDEENIFKMWYHTAVAPGHGVMCYATSEDGIEWVRPDLGLFDYEGSKANNIVMTHEPHEGKDHFETVLKDPLEKDPARRYKAIGWSSYDWDGPMSGIYTAVSPDGLNWTVMPEPVFHYHPRPGTDDLGPVGDAQSMMIDTLKNRYVAFLRHFPHRAISYSDDFVKWTQPETFIRTRHHRTEFYNSSGFVYSDIYLGIVTVFNLDQQVHEMNCHLLTSRDCRHWEMPETERPLIECGGIGEWNRFCTWNGGSPPIRCGDQLYLYFRGAARRHGPYEGPDNTEAPIHIGLAKLRVHGFASMGSSFDGGQFLTTRWGIDGGQLVLNAKSDYGEIRVELQDENEKPLPGYSLEDCDPVTADGLELPVTWKDQPDLSGAAGKTVRIRFQLKNARLYSYRRM